MIMACVLLISLSPRDDEVDETARLLSETDEPIELTTDEPEKVS